MSNVVMYTTMFCPFCYRAKKLLSKKGVEFTEIDIGAVAGARDEMLQRAGGRHTVPQIFIGQTHVGGCDDLFALERENRLDPLLRAG